MTRIVNEVRRTGIGLLLLALAAAGFTPTPNAVVGGSRPAPYGFFIPNDTYHELLQHHSVAIWLDRPQTFAELCDRHWVGRDRHGALIAFNREIGNELPEALDSELPAGVPIWIPPRERAGNTACVWILSNRDGWVSAQIDMHGIGDVAPTHAHAAGDSGSIDLHVYAVPLDSQREFAASVSIGAPNAKQPTRPAFGSFSFSQWVHERSKVARIVVSLPLAEIDGVIGFAEDPTVHYLDAYGKATSRWDPPKSPMLLILVSALGGALLTGLVLATRRGRKREPA